MSVTILTGDCRVHMAAMEPDSISAVVTDPPYELWFMGKGWDRSGVAFEVSTWRAAFRVLKPGGHLLAFGGTRLFHRMTVAIEDAGFEIRDCLSWLYGSGFPKSLDVSKAIDKAAGAEREVVGTKLGRPGMAKDGSNQRNGFDHAFGGEASGLMASNITAPATPAAEQWDGWGTALKPAWEPIIVARKPFRGTVAANVLTHGTGAINIDGTRIGTETVIARKGGFSDSPIYGTSAGGVYGGQNGRWPANVVLGCCGNDPHDPDCAAAMLDEQSGEAGGGFGSRGQLNGGATQWGFDGHGQTVGYGDTGGASRFFYTAKASRSERNKGLDGMPEQTVDDGRLTSIDNPFLRGETERRNTHPTVKPVDLMQWLVRLVTPPGGIVLDPFMGSGSTCIAADREGFDCIGIEISAEYVEIARRRIVGDCPMFAEVTA